MILASELKSNNYGRIYTSSDVVDELFTYLQRKGISHLAEKLYNEWFINDKMFGTMLFPTSESLKEAASIFSDQLHERKGLSFTDCLILATARHYHISNLLTFESGFHNLISVVQ